MERKFVKKEYDMAFRKATKKQFNVDLNPDEKAEIDKFLSEHKISKVDFVRDSFKKLKEELNMKKYIVTIETEHFKKKSANKYCYECLLDKFEPVYFATLNEAKKFVDDYNLECDKQTYDLYLDFLSVFKYNEETEEADSDSLYNRGFDYSKIEEEYNIKLCF